MIKQEINCKKYAECAVIAEKLQGKQHKWRHTIRVDAVQPQCSQCAPNDKQLSPKMMKRPKQVLNKSVKNSIKLRPINP
jgi:hypothetical protein